MTNLQLSIILLNIWVAIYNKDNKHIIGLGSLVLIIISFIEWVRQG
jgi:hypothetical protein